MTDLKNRDVFLRDPSSWSIPNLGVTKVGQPETDDDWAVLRYELENFVCEGEYESGLERVLGGFLANLGKPQQPAVWVSGFYGSGKSHFVRVLEYLWRDVEFPDGVRARSTCPSLSPDIRAHLTEISRLGRTDGGTWAAAGRLSAGASAARLALLSIVFRSAGLPEQYPLAQFVLWLKQEGRYDAVRAAVEARGRVFESELRNMWVSEHVAPALLEVAPGYADSPAAVREQLRTQYPRVTDISDDEMRDAMAQVLALQSTTPGKLPLTLLVFDELQQFLSEDPVRTLHVQEAVEELSSRFGGHILFVATGQASLQGTTQLQKLKGRFTVPIHLTDTDVDRVVRQVVLRKDEAKRAELKTCLDGASGEIDRHLADTLIGRRPEDTEERVADYPLLPVRRRFWEAALRAVDPAGTGGQLRTQLQNVHEATRDISDRPLGTVIPADGFYWKQHPSMLQSSVLDRDLSNMIQEMDDGSEGGRLKSRLCATIFLINKLEKTGPAATGVRATADALADLLVEDLTVGSTPLRKRIPELLNELVEASRLLVVDDDYRLQTAEDAEWDQDFRNRYAKIRDDDVRIASDRSAVIRTAVNAALKGMSLTQGKTKTVRKYDLYFSADSPPKDASNVPIWIRDEWTATHSTVRDEAQAAGPDSPIVFVSLPRLQAEELRQALARSGAAEDVCKTHTVKQTPAGLAAQAGMQARAKVAALEVEALVAEILKNGRVYQGGGNEVAEATFAESVRQAAQAGVERLFDRFRAADEPGWDKVVTRAIQGSPDPLTALGYTSEIEKHPVCQEIRSFVGGAGKRGSDVRKQFTSPRFGWSQDAVDGALLALLAAGLVRATRNGAKTEAKGLTQQQIGVTDFFSETTTITTPQKIAIRGLASAMGLEVKPGEEFEAIDLILKLLAGAAIAAGGEAPRPQPPDDAEIKRLQGMSGNDQFVAVHDERDQLQSWHKEWSSRGKTIEARMPQWERLNLLLGHATGLAGVEKLVEQAQAITSNRSLLADPDPMTPLIAEAAGALRAALTDVHGELIAARDAAVAELEATTEWGRLSADVQEQLQKRYQLGPIVALDVSTESALLAALEVRSLEERRTLIDAMPGRASRARQEAIRLLEPKAVNFAVPKATLRTAEDVDRYIDELREQLKAAVSPETPIVIS